MNKALVYEAEIFGKPLIQSFLYYAVDFFGSFIFLDSEFGLCLKINETAFPVVSILQ